MITRKELSQTFQKISTLQHLAKVSKNAKGTQSQPHEPRTKKAKMEKLDLPNEIWHKIINLMSTKDIFQNFSLVCKRFNNLTLDTSSLKSITLKNTSKMSVETMKNLKKVLQRSKKLQELELSEDRGFDPYAIFKCCFEACPQLKALTLSGYGWNFSVFSNSDFTWQTDVKHLTLSKDEGLGLGMYIASKLTNLRSLTLGVLNFRNSNMNVLAQECKKLEEVTSNKNSYFRFQ